MDELIHRCQGLLISHFHGDGEYVIFNEASGSTHLIDEASAEIILAVYEQPRARSELLGRLAKHFDQNVTVEMEQFLDGLILKCRELYLFEN